MPLHISVVDPSAVEVAGIEVDDEEEDEDEQHAPADGHRKLSDQYSVAEVGANGAVGFVLCLEGKARAYGEEHRL